MILLVDITEQWESKQALQEREKQYRALVDSITPPLIIIQGSELGIVYSNPATETVSGYTGEELKKMGGDWVVKVYYAADKETTRNDLLGILGGYESPFQGFENKFVHKNGTHFWLQSYPSRIVYNGQPAILILLVDITRLKDLEYSLEKSSANYEMLFDSTSDAIFHLKENHVSACNKSMLALLGCSKEQLLDKKHWQISPRYQPEKKSSKQKTLDIFEKVLSGKPQNLSWRYMKCDGTTFDCKIDMKRITLDNDELVQVILRENLV
ncbi:MAG: PAS domain-containing protein [Candidatus Thorarchaeota archaeon]